MSEDTVVLLVLVALLGILWAMFSAGVRAGRAAERQAWERAGAQQTKIFQEILIKIGIPAVSALDDQGRLLDPPPDEASVSEQT